MSTEFLVFVSIYGLALVAASLIVLTPRGQTLLLCWVERLGKGLGAGPWRLLETFGHEVLGGTMCAAERAVLAEYYVASAEKETLAGARVTLWVLIGGFVACAMALIIAIGVLPLLVESGQWSYETYLHAAKLVIYGTAAGGPVVGVCLVAWLLRRTMLLNRTDGRAIARDLLSVARANQLPSDISVSLAGGSYPRFETMLCNASA